MRNQLIINQGIEQTLLIQDRKRAVEVMYDGGRPRNVRQCFCLNDDRSTGRGMRLAFSRSGGQDMSSIQRFDGRPRMKTDIESQTKSACMRGNFIFFTDLFPAFNETLSQVLSARLMKQRRCRERQISRLLDAPKLSFGNRSSVIACGLKCSELKKL